jgi:hypothetical protein
MASYRYYAIVPDATGESVLLLRSNDRWTLPYI